MDIRGHLLEPPRDMTSLPMHSHAVSSSFKQQQQQQHAGSVAGGAQHVEVVPSASLLPSIAKVKIINTGTIHAGGSHGSNGLAAVATPSSAGASGSEISYFRQGLPPVKTSATAGGAGSYGNNVSPSNTSAGSLGHNGLTLTTGSPRPEPASANPASSDTVKAANNNMHMSSTLAKTTSATLYTDDLRMPTSLELKACKKAVRYRECLKNHAANLGGHANDGCGEFMPSGEEGTIEALKCAACSCHRNFHRREVDGEVYAANCECRYSVRDRKRIMEPIFPSPLPLPPPPGLRIHPRPSLPSSQMIMAFNSHDSDDYEGGLLSPQSPLKKRFRTKFTTEQKEKMGIFAEKLGWRMQKHDEAAVQQFCAEIGVKRHVLKVWMHNNKHALGKKLLTQGITDSGTQEEEIMP